MSHENSIGELDRLTNGRGEAGIERPTPFLSPRENDLFAARPQAHKLKFRRPALRHRKAF